MNIEFLETLNLYMNLPFVQNAIIVAILISLCSSLLGVTLVLKRFSFIGDGLSHVAFGAMAIAMALNFVDKMFLLLPITIISAILLLKSGRKAKMSGDAQIALVSVGALALGYLIINRFSKSANISADVCTTLFGSTSILTLTKTEVNVCIILSVVVVIVYILFYNKIFAVTFDENFAKGIGLNTEFYNLLIAIVIAVIIVLAMNLVGSLLISALIIFPAISAMQICRSFKQVTICAIIYSLVTTILGLMGAIIFDTPVGSTIVVVEIVIFIIFYILGKIKGGIVA